jgi:VWFA-related protein
MLLLQSHGQATQSRVDSDGDSQALYRGVSILLSKHSMPPSVAFLLGLAVLAQPQPQGPPPLTIKPAVAQMVIVDAFVIDRKGRPVTDLKVEDFALLEDDRKVTISAFLPPPPTLPVAKSATPGRAPAPIPDREPVTLVLYVDRRLLGPTGRRRATDQAFGIAEAHMAQGARAVVIADDNGLRPLTPITTDPTIIRTALTRIQGWATTSPSVSDARSTIENVKTIIEGNMAAGCDCVCSLPQSLQVVRGYAAIRDIEAKEASARLTFLMSALIGVSGRKSLLYVSEGLEDRPGLQLYEQLRNICPQAVLRDASSISAAMQELETAPILREMTARANAARVTIYPIDARGLVGLSSADILQINDRAYVPTAFNDRLREANLQAPLQRLGDDTGGFALLNGLDPKAAMKRFNADEAGHYILGFVPGEPDGKVHRLWLRLAGVAQDKRKVEIRHRESYLRAELPARRGQRALSALLFGLEENALDAQVEIERASTSKVLLQISVPVGALRTAESADPSQARLFVVIALRPSVGENAAIAVREKEVTVNLNAEEPGRGGGRRSFVVEVPVTEGGYEFAVGVEDVASGSTSYLRRMLEPAKSR